MTGPALLIVLLSVLLAGLETGQFNPLLLVSGTALWFLGTLVIYAVGHLLSRQGTFTHTFRALSFAQTADVLSLFALYGPIAPVARVIAAAVSILAMWMAAATAHDLKGWRAVVLPVVVILVYILGGVLVHSLVTGASFTWQSLGDALSLTPQ